MNPFYSLFWSFFKIGCFTFGGGYTMIMLIQREVVRKKEWVTEEEFMDYLSLAQSAPGPMAVNTALLIGYHCRKLPGAIAGFLGAVLPSFLVILGIALFFSRVYSDPLVVSIFKGVRPAVVALILYPVLSFSRNLHYWEYPIFLLIAFAIYASVSPLWFIAGTLTAAILWVWFRPNPTQQKP